MEGGRIVQCGTPRDIFSNPVNEYVADFVANMNPLGVLSARDVMAPLMATPEITVDVDISVREAMQKMIGSDAAVGVLEDGALIGQITADTIFERLLNPGGGAELPD